MVSYGEQHWNGIIWRTTLKNKNSIPTRHPRRILRDWEGERGGKREKERSWGGKREKRDRENWNEK